MGSSRRLTGLVISEERVLAGRLAGFLYVIGGATALSLLILPAVDVSSPRLLVGLAAGGALWGVACLTLIPWRTAAPWVSHISTAAGLPVAALAMAATGGGSSPARFYLLFILFYASYFYPAREAVPYIVACIATLTIPLAYGAGHGPYVAELIVAAPTYAVLGSLLVAGKGVLVDLRERADDLARHDVLTGLANRRALMDELNALVAGTTRAGTGFGFVLLDVDDFKSANTRFGHQGGDEVLCCAASALLEASRGSDTVARLGGDEFAVIVRHSAPEAMDAACERLLAAVRGAVAEGEIGEMRVTASAGWAFYPDDAASVEGLISIADRAMQRAKADGKDRSLAPTALA